MIMIMLACDVCINDTVSALVLVGMVTVFGGFAKSYHVMNEHDVAENAMQKLYYVHMDHNM